MSGKISDTVNSSFLAWEEAEANINQGSC